MQVSTSEFDETDVLPQQLHILLRKTRDHLRRCAAARIGRDVDRQTRRRKRDILLLRGVEIGELHRCDLVLAFGTGDERVFELTVAGRTGRRGLHRLGRLDVVLLERTGKRQFGRLYERQVARTRNLDRIGRRRVGRQLRRRNVGGHRELADGTAETCRSARGQVAHRHLDRCRA